MNNNEKYICIVAYAFQLLDSSLPWPLPMFGQITEVGFFKKIIFFDFGGPKKTFLTPQNQKNPHFWVGGGSYF